MADGVVVTPYALLQRLGISPGASIPALRRLEKERLTHREKAGSRRRQAFILTERGREVLQRDLDKAIPELLENPPLGAESLCRIVALSRSGHAGVGAAIPIVEAALATCIENAKSVEQHLPSLHVMAGTADIYTWALANMELIRWKSQAVAIRKVLYAAFAPRVIALTRAGTLRGARPATRVSNSLPRVEPHRLDFSSPSAPAMF